MLTEKAAKFLNVLIQGELSNGITECLVFHLRDGNAAHISQETWDKLAAWLESGCKRPRKRPPTGQNPEIRARNLEIKQEYKAEIRKGKSPEQARAGLAEKYRLHEDSIIYIVRRSNR